MSKIKLKTIVERVVSERTEANRKLYDAAKNISIDILGYKPNGRVTWEFTRRWNRGVSFYLGHYFDIAIRIPFYNVQEMKDAERKIESYKLDDIKEATIYYFPKYKVYGKIVSWSDKERYLGIFGKTMFKNMIRDLQQNKIR